MNVHFEQGPPSTPEAYWVPPMPKTQWQRELARGIVIGDKLPLIPRLVRSIERLCRGGRS